MQACSSKIVIARIKKTARLVARRFTIVCLSAMCPFYFKFPQNRWMRLQASSSASVDVA
jgi:hypothetical protein